MITVAAGVTIGLFVSQFIGTSEPCGGVAQWFPNRDSQYISSAHVKMWHTSLSKSTGTWF